MAKPTPYAHEPYNLDPINDPLADGYAKHVGQHGEDWKERVTVLASLLPDDLTDLSTLSDEEHQRVIDIVQTIKARFDRG